MNMIDSGGADVNTLVIQTAQGRSQAMAKTGGMDKTMAWPGLRAQGDGYHKRQVCFKLL